MDAVGSERAALLGISEGGPLCILFAASYPERTRATNPLRDVCALAASRRLPDRYALEGMGGDAAGTGDRMGRRRRAALLCAELPKDDPKTQQMWALSCRNGASPGAALALLRMNERTDVRNVLPAIRVPTLVLHRKDDRLIYFALGKLLAGQNPRGDAGHTFG